MSVKRPESARQEGKRPRFFVVLPGKDDLRMTTEAAKYAKLVGSAAEGAVTG